MVSLSKRYVNSIRVILTKKRIKRWFFCCTQMGNEFVIPRVAYTLGLAQYLHKISGRRKLVECERIVPGLAVCYVGHFLRNEHDANNKLRSSRSLRVT